MLVVYYLVQPEHSGGLNMGGFACLEYQLSTSQIGAVGVSRNTSTLNGNLELVVHSLYLERFKLLLFSCSW